MLPSECLTALKEWAVTVKALDRGEQVLLLRKGGIREDEKDFRILYPEFLLYPTYEHQSESLLKERYHSDLRHVLSETPDEGSITFTHFARTEEVIELTEQGKVEALSALYIWTEDYAQKRLHWKPRHPLSIILLRLYRLEAAITVPYLSRYGGCKSWVELDQPLPLGRLSPVLSDEEFHQRVQEVRDALRHGSGAPVVEQVR